MAPEPKADPKKIHDLDGTIKSTLELAFMLRQIDQVDALFLLVLRLPEWGASEEFVTDMVRESFKAHRAREAKK